MGWDIKETRLLVRRKGTVGLGGFARGGMGRVGSWECRGWMDGEAKGEQKQERDGEDKTAGCETVHKPGG